MNKFLKEYNLKNKKMLGENIKDINKAIAFFEWAKEDRGEDSAWSIQYWGFGEHFTHWSGDGTFIDFNIDKGAAISWDKMKDILINSANNLRERMLEESILKQNENNH